MNLSRFQAVLLDLDGTIYNEEHVLPGAVELVRNLRAQGRKFACLSNSTLSPENISQRLRRMGIEIQSGNIYSAAAAAVDYVLERFGPMPRVYNLATDGVEQMLEGRVQWVDWADQPCDAVIAGAPANVFATEARQRIALLLLRNGASLVGICPDRVYPSPRGLEFGVGAISHMLGYAANVTPVFCGKPLRVFFDKVCQMLQADPRQCVLIGDNVESDIEGGKGVGMYTILTLTGITHRQDLPGLPASQTPDAVIEDLRELVV